MKTDAITLQREDIVLSSSEVRVRYEMRNDTGQPVTLRVAFSMPNCGPRSKSAPSCLTAATLQRPYARSED